MMIANHFLLPLLQIGLCDSNKVSIYGKTSRHPNRQTNKQTIENGCCLMINHNITTTSPFFYKESLPYQRLNGNMNDK